MVHADFCSPPKPSKFIRIAHWNTLHTDTCAVVKGSPTIYWNAAWMVLNRRISNMETATILVAVQCTEENNTLV